MRHSASISFEQANFLHSYDSVVRQNDRHFGNQSAERWTGMRPFGKILADIPGTIDARYIAIIYNTILNTMRLKEIYSFVYT